MCIEDAFFNLTFFSCVSTIMRIGTLCILVDIRTLDYDSVEFT